MKRSTKKLIRALDNVAAAVRGDHLPQNSAEEHATYTTAFEVGYRRAETYHGVPPHARTSIGEVQDQADQAFGELLDLRTKGEKAK